MIKKFSADELVSIEGDAEPFASSPTHLTTKLPKTCCRNVSSMMGEFKECGKPATLWYQHGNDVCSFCEEHDSQCGEPIYARK